MRSLSLAILLFPFLIYSQEIGHTYDLPYEVKDYDTSLDSLIKITIDNSIVMRVDQFKKIGFVFYPKVETLETLRYSIREMNIDFVVNGILASNDSIIDITKNEIVKYEDLSKRKLRKKYGYVTRFGALSITTDKIKR